MTSRPLMSRFAIRSAIVRTPLAIAARASRALLVLASVAVACSRPDRGKDATAKPPGAARTDTGMAAMPGMKGAPTTVTLTADQLRHGGIRWSAAAAGPSLTETTLPGTVVANDDRSAQLGASARGRVVSVHVGPGDRVTDGQLLVRLQSADAAMSQSEVTKATAELAARRAQAVSLAMTVRSRRPWRTSSSINRCGVPAPMKPPIIGVAPSGIMAAMSAVWAVFIS